MRREQLRVWLLITKMSPVEQPQAEVRLQLRERLARRLGGDRLRRGRLPQAAELGSLDEGGDGAQFVEGHGDRRDEGWPIITICLSVKSAIVG